MSSYAFLENCCVEIWPELTKEIGLLRKSPETALVANITNQTAALRSPVAPFTELLRQRDVLRLFRHIAHLGRFFGGVVLLTRACL